MDAERFYITNFRAISLIHDAKGRYLDMKNRHCAVILFTLEGSVRFTQGGRVFVSDGTYPLFIPKGASYINECIEEARTMMFSFETSADFDEICYLSPVADAEMRWYYDMIDRAEIEKKSGYRQRQLSLFYDMTAKMLASPKSAEGIAEKCAMLIRKRYDDASFFCSDIARELFISETYMRREFKKEYTISVGEYLRRVRMERARELLFEKRSVSEAARATGYSDVYQFSRAYKAYFGTSPSRASEKGSENEVL